MTNPDGHIRTIIQRNWFLLLLLLTLFVGAQFSQPLRPLSEFTWLRNALVASVLFVTALPVRLGGITALLRSPGAVLLACAISWIVIPLIAIPVVRWRGDALGVGVMVAAVAPGTLASAAVWTRKARGNELIPIAVTLLTNPLSCVVIPLWLSMVTSAVAVALDPLEMMIKLGLLVVLPMALAQLVRAHQPMAAWSERRKPTLTTLALAGILTIVLIGAIQCGLQIQAMGQNENAGWVRFWPIALIVAGIHLCGLLAAVGSSIALGFAPEDRIGIAFAGSQKTLMVGIQVAFMLGGGLIVIPIVFYHVLQLVIDAWIAGWWATDDVVV